MIVIKHRKSADVVLMRVNARRLDDQDLTGAYLLGAEMAGLRGRRLLLRDANLRNASLRGADLRGAVLQGAVLRGADLRDCNLSDARLAEADLRGADLRGADLRGADLSRAMLFDANVAGVRCDQRTCWPQGECWGLVARPAVSAPVGSWSLVECVADAHRWVVHGCARHRFVPVRQPQATPLLGTAYRLTGVGLAMALVAVAVADLHLRLDSASVPPARPPQMAVQVSPPEQLEAPVTRTRPVPTRHSAPAAAPRLEQRPRRAHLRPNVVEPQRLATTHAAPAPATRSRVAGLRVAHRRPAGNSTPIAPSAGIRLASTHRGAGSTARTGRVLLTSYVAPSRPQKNPVTEPTTTSPEPAPAPPVEVAAVEPPRPKFRSEARRKSPAVAWGNAEFHYGSGYDIYSMHLGPDPE